MRLLTQRVARASVEVDGIVEGRIGPGLVLSVGLAKGDTVETAEQLASKVLELNLFPELMDPDTQFQTNVVDNGGEVLVLLQQSLCASFPKTLPNQDRALSVADAKPVFSAFVAKLKEGYQEEMVISVSPEAADVRLELALEAAGVFELGTREALGPAPKAKAKAGAVAVEPLKAEVPIVTRALRRLAGLPRGLGQSRAEAARLLRALGSPRMKASLGDAAQAEADAFAESLDSAAHLFTAKQQEQIMAWTGLTITAEPAPESEEVGKSGAVEDDEALERQLSELKQEVDDPMLGISAAKRRRMGLAVKQEEEQKLGPSKAERVRPDITGRAAPETPAAAAARQWAANRRAARVGEAQPQAVYFSGKGGGKGVKGGKGARPPRRSWGIVSLDESSRLHGQSSGEYGYGQLSQKYFEQNAKVEEAHTTPRVKQPKELPKGTPTVAPMCPAPGEVGEEL